jgi:hypothetical protein
MKTIKCNKCKINDVEEGLLYTCCGSPNNHAIVEFVCNCCTDCADKCTFDQTA